MDALQIGKIIRSSRKTAALHVLNDATLVIRVPYAASEEYIRKLVTEKSEWILQKQEFFRQRALKLKPKRYVNGEKFLFMGIEYELEIVSAGNPAVYLNGKLKMTELCLRNPSKYMEAWYRTCAKKYLIPRVEQIAKQYGFCYRSVKTNGASSRWGSCGFRNSLNFSWRLMAAPPEVIDSVIAHELVHTEIKNHSKGFYKRLAEINPLHRQSEKWLKENGWLNLV